MVAEKHPDMFGVEIKVIPAVCLLSGVHPACKYVNASAFSHSALDVQGATLLKIENIEHDRSSRGPHDVITKNSRFSPFRTLGMILSTHQ